MTPLKPIENLRVRGVAAQAYPINDRCSHPECDEYTHDRHHCFPRSQIVGDSWFVEVELESDETGKYPHVFRGGSETLVSRDEKLYQVGPHVTGLCNFHHGIVETHLAWIRLENCEYVWYDRDPEATDALRAARVYDDPTAGWVKLGALNPQPGSREGKPKRKKFKGEARRQRKTISIKVPADKQEDGGEVWDVLLEAVYERLESAGMKDVREKGVYIALVAVIHDWLTS